MLPAHMPPPSPWQILLGSAQTITAVFGGCQAGQGQLPPHCRSSAPTCLPPASRSGRCWREGLCEGGALLVQPCSVQWGLSPRGDAVPSILQPSPSRRAVCVHPEWHRLPLERRDRVRRGPQGCPGTRAGCAVPGASSPSGWGSPALCQYCCLPTGCSSSATTPRPCFFGTIHPGAGVTSLPTPGCSAVLTARACSAWMPE